MNSQSFLNSDQLSKQSQVELSLIQNGKSLSGNYGTTAYHNFSASLCKPGINLVQVTVT
jgi:hypothetical protein